MNSIPLGTSGVEVSALCLGAMYFGSRNDRNTSYQILDQYIDAGGTFIDTANIYVRWIEGFSGGESETLLGAWMKERGNRSDLFVATKVGFEYPGVERGLKAAQIEAECNKSLKRMGIDTIDLYYGHVDDYDTPLEETMEAFNRLVKAGKVRFIGASNYLAWRLAEAHGISETNGWADFCCVQQRHSYLRPNPGADFGAQKAANNDLIDYARARSITILAYSAMLGGAYTRRDRELAEAYVGADSDARLHALKEMANEVNATPSQVVLAWMLHSDPTVLPLIAASTPEVMADNLGALDVTLTPDQLQRLNQAGA